MADCKTLKVLVLSVVKHDYIAEAFQTHPGFRIVGVADDATVPDWIHDRHEEFARRMNVPYIRNPDNAIASLQPDVAVVSSEAERHCELALRAVAAGLHIVIDKPLSTRLEDCDQIVAAVRSANVKSLVWNRNLLPSLLQARHVLEAGEIGDIRAAHCDFYFAKDAGPPKGTRRPGDPPIDWLLRQIEAHADGSDGAVGKQPMGELQVEAIYPLAYLRMLTGRRVQRVFTRTTTHFHQAHSDNHVDDLATVTLEFTDGVIGSLCIGRIGVASHPELGDIRLHLTGTAGAIVVSEPRPEVAVYYRGQPAEEYRRRRLGNDGDFLLVEDFLTAIEHGGTTVLDVAAGREICAVVEACLRSAESGSFETVANAADPGVAAPFDS